MNERPAHPARERLVLYLEAVVVLAAVATIPVMIAEVRGGMRPAIVATNWIIWCVFLFEFLALLVLDPPAIGNRRRHLFSAVVVLLSFPLAPGLLDAIRLVRLVRLARLIRLLAIFSRGIRALQLIFLRRGLLLVAALTLSVVLVGGGIMASVEPETARGGYWSGVWWAIVTLTTVGYGDIAPVTLAGRIVAGILMFSGIGLFSTLAAAVAAYFVGEDEGQELRDIKEQLDRIEVTLQQLTGQRRNDDTSDLLNRQTNTASSIDLDADEGSHDEVGA